MVEVMIVGAEIWLIEDLLFTCCDTLYVAAAGSGWRLNFGSDREKSGIHPYGIQCIGPKVSLLEVQQ